MKFRRNSPLFVGKPIPRRRNACQFGWNVVVCDLALTCGLRADSAGRDIEFQAMPSLIRLLMVVGLLGGAAYGAMFALANFVQPKQREMTITIPQQRLKPN
jgi:hypothetical protein